MKVFRGYGGLALAFILAVSGAGLSTVRADTVISTPVSPEPDGTNFNVFVAIEVVTNSDGVGSTIDGPLLSVTDGGNNVPFAIIVQNPLIEIDNFAVSVPAGVLTNAVTLTWTNYSTNVLIVSAPVFLTRPAGQSVVAGRQATFYGPAVHTSGYQWQLNGTNLVEGGHYIGVTTSTLTVSNVQMADAGDYTVIAAHPINPATADASLSVYKPLRLGLGAVPGRGGLVLLVANQDGSPLEPERVPNLQIYSCADLDSDFSAWNLETTAGAVSDGVLQIPVANDGTSAKYFRLFEP